jgi:hypothetical protein
MFYVEDKNHSTADFSFGVTARDSESGPSVRRHDMKLLTPVTLLTQQANRFLDALFRDANQQRNVALTPKAAGRSNLRHAKPALAQCVESGTCVPVLNYSQDHFHGYMLPSFIAGQFIHAQLLNSQFVQGTPAPSIVRAMVNACYADNAVYDVNRDAITVAQGSNQHQAHRHILKEAAMIVSVG